MIHLIKSLTFIERNQHDELTFITNKNKNSKVTLIWTSRILNLNIKNKTYNKK